MLPNYLLMSEVGSRKRMIRHLSSAYTFIAILHATLAVEVQGALYGRTLGQKIKKIFQKCCNLKNIYHFLSLLEFLAFLVFQFVENTSSWTHFLDFCPSVRHYRVKTRPTLMVLLLRWKHLSSATRLWTECRHIHMSYKVDSSYL